MLAPDTLYNVRNGKIRSEHSYVLSKSIYQLSLSSVGWLLKHSLGWLAFIIEEVYSLDSC